MLTSEGYRWLGKCLADGELPPAALRVTCKAGTYDEPARARLSRLNSDRLNLDNYALVFTAPFPLCVVESPRTLELVSEGGQVVARQFTDEVYALSAGIVRVDMTVTIRVEASGEHKPLHTHPLDSEAFRSLSERMDSEQTDPENGGERS